MNTSVLIKYIGSPYVDSKIKLSEDELKDVYELAFKNRVALLLLSKQYSKDWKGFALDKYKMLKNRAGFLVSKLEETKSVNKRVKILIVRPKIHKPKAAPIKLTGKVIAGTIIALIFPKNK